MCYDSISWIFLLLMLIINNYCIKKSNIKGKLLLCLGLILFNNDVCQSSFFNWEC